ncbi:unnamed protein product, partial [Brassica oleracea]
MASSDVVLAHSAFDALPLGRSAQIIVGHTGRQALGPQAKKPKPNQLSIYKLHQILTYCATHNDMCAAHPIHLYLSTPENHPESEKSKPEFLRNLLREFLQPLLPPLVFVDEEEESTDLYPNTLGGEEQNLLF